MSGETLPTESPEEFKSANPQEVEEPLFTDKEIAHAVAIKQKNSEETLILQREQAEAAEPGSHDDIYGGRALAVNEASDEHVTGALKRTHDELMAARPANTANIKASLSPAHDQETVDKVVAAELSRKETPAIDKAHVDAVLSGPQFDDTFREEVIQKAKALEDERAA